MILGIVHGRARTTEYSFRILDIKKVIKGQYVIAIDKETNRRIFGHVIDIETAGRVAIAKCEVLGELKDANLVSPKRPVSAGSQVVMPNRELLERLLVRSLPKERMLIGRVLTHPEFVPVYYNPRDLAKHLFITATTGGGKSYTICVFIEELFRIMEESQEDFSIVIFDVHNEYGSILLPNDDSKQIEKLRNEYNYEPRGFDKNVIIFDWEWNPPYLSPIFTPDRLLFIYGIKEQRYAFILRELIGDKEEITLEELSAIIESSDLHAATKQALLIRVRGLMESNLFSDKFIKPENFLKPGWAVIFRLANTPLGDYGIRFFVADILRQIFDQYKTRKIKHKTVIIIDEAHLLAPRKGRRDPVREVIERIAREGRKYNLWLILASQSPRDLSDVILMQCNSVLALKMHKEDVSEFSRTFGISRSIAEALTMFPPGKGYLKAPSLAIPVIVEIRPKRSLDIKGIPEKIRAVEDAVKRVALISKELLKEAEEKKIEEKREVSVISEPSPKIKEPSKEISKIEVKEAKIKKVPEKEVTKKVVKKAVIKREPIKYDLEVINSIISEIREQGYAARALIKELIIEREKKLSEVLASVDDRIIDTLKLLGIIEIRGGIIRLSLKELMERRMGRRLNELEVKRYIEMIYDRV